MEGDVGPQESLEEGGDGTTSRPFGKGLKEEL